jgi:hypothetical protein
MSKKDIIEDDEENIDVGKLINKWESKL